MVKIVKFCSISLAISGKPSVTLDAVLDQFDLSQPGDQNNVYDLEVFEVPPNTRIDNLPEWLCGHLTGFERCDNAIMFHGPDGECGVIATDPNIRSCVWFSPRRRLVRFWSQKLCNDKVAFTFPVSACLTGILREILTHHGALLVHAAGIRFHHNVGILMCADGGGGKSTTSLAAVKAGGQLLADDLVTISRTDTGEIVLTGFPEVMNLTDHTLEIFPELRAEQPHVDLCAITEKRKINPVAAYPSLFTYSAVRFKFCCYLEKSASGPTLAPIAPQDFLGRLIRSHTFAIHQSLSPKTTDLLFQISASIPAYTLQTGPDPLALGEWLSVYSSSLRTCANTEAGETFLS